METIQFFLDGFAVACQPVKLLYCFIGVLWGTIVGILPGLGPLAGMTLLLPLTFKLDPASAIIMLAGIFYGAMYGGSLTSILVRIPGEAASVITCIDGYEMARRGRAGPALAIAAIGSWFGGVASVVGLMLFAPPMAEAMLKIGPPAEFVLMLLALLVMSFVSSSPPLKTIAMILMGLAIATVGMDPITGFARFTYGNLRLADGLSFVAIALGLFGVSEILLNLEDVTEMKAIRPTFRSLLPSKAEWKASAPAVGRGTVIGFLFGMVPGVSHIISTFVSYAVERRVSKHPERFGKGAVEGVAGPETANNATTGSAMIPLLVLGIPAIPATAVLLSAMLIHGVQPGPQLLLDHPDVFWGLIASMVIGNAILVVLNLPMVPLFVNILRVPYPYLAPSILLISVIGVYSVNANPLDLWLMMIGGLAGYLLRKFGFDVAPLLLAIVLGDRIEMAFRRSLTISDGHYGIFLEGPAVKVLLISALFLGLLLALARFLGYRRDNGSV
ncbi:MAG: tripartite tricarboxylate transporter permease [Desulfobacterales bacterium]|jgi:putative tricarboxylic transport membrane protein|nr:tripartite tricarboxylate transporter permease [Desulfobacterales bacterium]